MAYQDIGIRIQIQGMSQFKRDLSQIDRSLQGVTKGFTGIIGAGSGFGGFISNLGTNLDRIGTSLTQNLTLPLVAASTALVASGVLFEDAFAGVGKTVDGVMDNFGNLTERGKEVREEFRQLSLEIPIAVTELSRIGQVGGQLGIDIDQLEEFTRLSAMLGVATDFTSEEAATSLARLGNIMGIESNRMIDFISRTGNAVVGLGNNFAATEPEILALSLRIAGAAKAVGATTPEILALSTALAAMGVPAELGGSAVSRVFIEMQSSVNSFDKTTQEGNKQLAAFADVMGIAQQAVVQLFRTNPTQAFLMLFESLSKMNEEGSLTDDVLKGINLEQIRMKDVLNRVGPNVSLVTSALIESNTQWEQQDALLIEFNKKAATTASKLTIARNAVVYLGTALFDKLKPGIDAVIEGFTNFITNVADRLTLDDSFYKNITLIVAGLIILGPALKGIGLALQLIGPLFSSFTLAFSALSFLIANPILLGGLIAIGAAIAGLAYIITNDLFGVGDIFKQIADSIGVLFDSLDRNTNTITNLKNAFKNLLAGDFEGAFSQLKLAVEGFIFWLQNIGWPIIQEEWLKLRPLLLAAGIQVGKAIWTWVSEVAWPEAKTQFEILITNIINWIKDQKDPLAKKLEEWVDAFVNWVDESWPGWLEKAEALVTDIIGWVGDQVDKLANKLLDWIFEFQDWATKIWPDLLLNMVELIGRIVGWILLAGYYLGTQLIEVWVPAFVDWAKEIWPKLQLKFLALQLSLINYLRNDFGNDLKNVGDEIGRRFIQGIADGIGANPNVIMGALLAAVDKLGIPGWAKDSLKAILVPGAAYIAKSSSSGGTTTASSYVSQISPQTALKAIQMSALSKATLQNALAPAYNTTSSNISSRSTTYAPTINGVPMQNSDDAGKAAYDSFLRMYGVTNK